MNNFINIPFFPLVFIYVNCFVFYFLNQNFNVIDLKYVKCILEICINFTTNCYYCKQMLTIKFTANLDDIIHFIIFLMCFINYYDIYYKKTKLSYMLTFSFES